MGEQKFGEKFPETVYSIKDKPLAALTRLVIKLRASLEENVKILEEGEELLADGAENNRISKELGFEQDRLNELRQRIAKTKNEIETTEIMLKSYEREIDALQRSDVGLQRIAQSKMKKKNRPSA